MIRRLAHRCLLLLAVGTAGAACGMPAAARAAPLSAAAFAGLAASCAPAVAAATLEAVARTESGLDPWALHDNTTGASEKPASLEAALAAAGRWLARGDKVDLGLMQINSANLAALGMTVPAALDPCAALAGGAAVLRAAYDGGTTAAERQAALLMALSRYNTGSPFKGIMNGYARRVIANRDTGQGNRVKGVWGVFECQERLKTRGFTPGPQQRRSLCNPFRDAGLGPLAPAGSGQRPGSSKTPFTRLPWDTGTPPALSAAAQVFPTPSAAPPAGPPAWDVWEQAASARAHGALWLVAPTPAPGNQPSPPATASPAATMVAAGQAGASIQPISRSQ
jgi:type IV secretion system protein VirB1